MEPTLPPTTPANTTATPVIHTQITQSKPDANYFVRLFSGRLNRQNYIVGSTVLVLLPILCFLVVLYNILLNPDTFAMPYLDPTSPTGIVTPHISIMSLLTTPSNELWTGLGMFFFVISIPYLFSIQIRRQHDLNLNGWLCLINLAPLLFIKSMLSFNDSFKIDIWFLLLNFISLISSIFTLYVTFCPGTNGPNKYGDKPLPGSNLLKDILQVK